MVDLRVIERLIFRTIRFFVLFDFFFFLLLHLGLQLLEILRQTQKSYAFWCFGYFLLIDVIII